MSRAKGNRFERDVARRIIAADGPDPVGAGLQSAAGRIGHLDLGLDAVSRRFAIEVKCRESIGAYLWDWLDHLATRGGWRSHVDILVVGRNRRRPLVVLDLDDFLTLTKERHADQPD